MGMSSVQLVFGHKINYWTKSNFDLMEVNLANLLATWMHQTETLNTILTLHILS